MSIVARSVWCAGFGAFRHSCTCCVSVVISVVVVFGSEAVLCGCCFFSRLRRGTTPWRRLDTIPLRSWKRRLADFKSAARTERDDKGGLPDPLGAKRKEKKNPKPLSTPVNVFFQIHRMKFQEISRRSQSFSRRQFPDFATRIHHFQHTESKKKKTFLN